MLVPIKITIRSIIPGSVPHCDMDASFSDFKQNSSFSIAIHMNNGKIKQRFKVSEWFLVIRVSGMRCSETRAGACWPVWRGSCLGGPSWRPSSPVHQRALASVCRASAAPTECCADRSHNEPAPDISNHHHPSVVIKSHKRTDDVIVQQHTHRKRLHRVPKTHQLWNAIARNCKDRFWWNLA